ncbi:MraY family glycosyltransferase [Botrimarina sp.]|uniref:glycosyltransferase family 4 protein n=1 Tax=Botrimarina sp. TaxID=2795802 RepID=UPI0032EBEF4B
MNLSAMFFSEYRAATYLLAIGVGWFATYLLTPVVRKASHKLGFVDRPGGRKVQAHAVALGGGVAVFTGALAAVAVAFLFADIALSATFFGGDARLLSGLALAAAATLALGVYDDATNLRGIYKLLGQVAIAGLLVYLGLRMDRFELFGNEITLGWLAVPFSMFWLVGSTNAINLLDGIDGLASGIGLVLCLTLASINALFGHFPEAVVMLALAGALVGFLRYNFAPATIYLGDAGSMLIGLVIGAIAMETHAKTPAFVAMVVPLAVWAVPILDSGAAIVRRRLTGRSIFAPDRGHLHHSLLTRGWSVRQATIFIVLICAVTCLSAVLGVLWRNEWVVIATVAFVLVFLIGSKTFGHVEFALVRDRVRPLGRGAGAGVSPGAVRLQGSHEWETLWTSLVEAAPTYGITKLQLTIHMPAVHEAFFARWRGPKTPKALAEATWRLTQPLLVDGETVGKLELAGLADGDKPTSEHLAQVLDFLEPIEDDIRRVKRLLAAQQTQSAEGDPEPAASRDAVLASH